MIGHLGVGWRYDCHSLTFMTSGDEFDVEGRLRSVIERAEIAVLANDAGLRHLYDDDVVTRPLFCFGRAATASHITIGANPSADDFRAGRWNPVADLADQSFSYFDRVVPHEYFRNWEAALSPLGLSYRAGLAHVDVSPRATKSLRAINKLGDPVIDDFLVMARSDATHLFGMLAVLWPQLRGLFVAGTITKKHYLDAFLRSAGARHGFVWRRHAVFPGRATTPAACSKVYDLRYLGRSVPLFFCPVGASADRPGDQEYFQAQVRDNVTRLRSVFL